MKNRVEWTNEELQAFRVDADSSYVYLEDAEHDVVAFDFSDAHKLINAIAEVCGLTVTIGKQPPAYDAQFDALAKRVEQMEERFVAVWNKSSQLAERVEALESAWLHDNEPQDEPEPLERIDAKLDTILDRITAPGYEPQRLGQQYRKDGK